MISVLSSVYNETLAEIRESIDSILSQSYTDFELIVSNRRHKAGIISVSTKFNPS